MLEWIISSCVLILFMLALRTAFRGRIDPIFQYALWAIVLIRLLIPLNIGSTAVSVLNLKDSLEQQPTIQSVVDAGNIPLSTQSYEEAYQHVVDQYEAEGILVEHLDPEAFSIIEAEIQATMSGPTFMEIAKSVLLWVWLTGIAAVSVVFIYTNLRFYKTVCQKSAGTGKSIENISVRVVKNMETPCLFGFLRPVIYITDDAYEDDIYFRHTVEHEYTHYLHKDHIWSVLRGICVALHWYNPLVWIAAVMSQRDGEIACDEATIKRIGEQERAAYGRTLIRMTCRKKTNVLATATTMNASKRGIKERILLIAKKPKMAVYTCVAILAIVAIVVICSFTGSDKKENETQNAVTEQQLGEFFDQYTKGETPNYSDAEINIIASTEEYALVFSKGIYTDLVLYRYEVKDDSIRVLDAMSGAYKLNKGITVNHWKEKDSHIYFGTVADYKGTWKELVMIDVNGKETICNLQEEIGYLCILEAPLSYFKVMTETGYTATDLEEYLEKNKIVEVENIAERLPTVPTENVKPTETTVPPETTQLEETVGTWPYADQNEFDNKYPSLFILEGSDIGPLYKDKVYGLISLGLHTTLSGEAYVYVIPENQEEIISAFKNAYAEVKTEKSVSNFASGFLINYQGDTWHILGDGSVYMHDNGKCNIIPPDASTELVDLCEAALRKVGIPEAVGPDDITRIKSATLRWNGIHTLTDTVSLQFIESLLSNSQDLGYGAGCPFGALLTLEMTNGKTITVTMATDGCDVWMSEGKFYTFYPQDGSDNDGNRPFYQLFAMRALYYAASGHMDKIPYLVEYLDWDQYAQTYGDQEVRYLMNQLKAWIQEDYKERISYAFWRLPDLTGGYSGTYAAMLVQLYNENPAVFAKTCLEEIYNETQENLLRLLGQYWNMNINEVRGKLREAISNP
jgi:beta-lactamase regulating signal transducer with metallopeptidase domain